jgi:toxin YoeB
VKITWHEDTWEEYLYWQSADRRILRRINNLIRDIGRGDEGGIGKPEQLTGDLSGYFSRRIDEEHRLVYRVDNAGETLIVVACRYHYSK